jgi:hypothetical protein
MTKEKIVAAMKATAKRDLCHLLIDSELDLTTAPLCLVTPIILRNLILPEMNSMLSLMLMMTIVCFTHFTLQEVNGLSP